MIFVLGLGFAGTGSGIRQGEGSQLQFLPLHKKSLPVVVLRSVCWRGCMRQDLFSDWPGGELRRGLRPKTLSPSEDLAVWPWEEQLRMIGP